MTQATTDAAFYLTESFDHYKICYPQHASENAIQVSLSTMLSSTGATATLEPCHMLIPVLLSLLTKDNNLPEKNLEKLPAVSTH